jgi:hypothetical protein
LRQLATQRTVTASDVKCRVAVGRHLAEKETPVVLIMVVLRHSPSLAVDDLYCRISDGRSPSSPPSRRRVAHRVAGDVGYIKRVAMGFAAPARSGWPGLAHCAWPAPARQLEM